MKLAMQQLRRSPRKSFSLGAGLPFIRLVYYQIKPSEARISYHASQSPTMAFPLSFLFALAHAVLPHTCSAQIVSGISDMQVMMSAPFRPFPSSPCPSLPFPLPPVQNLNPKASREQACCSYDSYATKHPTMMPRLRPDLPYR